MPTWKYQRRFAATRLLLALLLVAVPGCSIRRLAVNSLADTMASSGELFASDEDPELVRDAVPFALKTIEALLAEVPKHRGLLLTACSGFTQYAYAFVEADARLLEAEDYFTAKEMRQRALRLYLRARDYCLTSLELQREGITRQLMLEAEPAAAALDDVPLIYWTGAAWGKAISLGSDRPELVADLPAVMALMRRALELDEDYGDGAVHEVLIALEALPEAMGGSRERAREHYRRALELSGGDRAGTFVTLAVSVSVAEQDRQEFVDLLNRALAVDVEAAPAWRLQNVIDQQQARGLLTQIDELFLDPADLGEEGDPTWDE